MSYDTPAYDDFDACLAALAWALDCGVDEVIGDAPINRFEVVATKPEVVPARPVQPLGAVAKAVEESAPAPKVDPLAEAQVIVSRATNLADLHQALIDFPYCELKEGAQSTVFGVGNPKARVMVLTDAPRREEDREGKPFAGQSALLVEKMFAAIGLDGNAPDPERALYCASIFPWRPEGDREPNAEELAMIRPFFERHIQLVDPDFIVVMGNTPLRALTGERAILRSRGRWFSALEKPVIAMLPPVLLLREPQMKREAWADLLALSAKLKEG